MHTIDLNYTYFRNLQSSLKKKRRKETNYVSQKEVNGFVAIITGVRMGTALVISN